MSPSDYDLVSTEDHELEYILKKYNKSTSNSNKDVVKEMISFFKNNSKYSPYNHTKLWLFIDNKEYPKFNALN